jgi:hypothetical protein
MFGEPMAGEQPEQPLEPAPQVSHVEEQQSLFLWHLARRRSRKLGFFSVQHELLHESQHVVGQAGAQTGAAQAGTQAGAQAGAAQVGAQADSQQDEDLRNLAFRRSQKLGLAQQSEPHESLTAPQPPPAPHPPGIGVETTGPAIDGAA